MEPVRIFSGNEQEAASAQFILNSHLIGTWVRQACIDESANDEDALSTIEIFIEAEFEAKARLVLAAEKPNMSALNTVF